MNSRKGRVGQKVSRKVSRRVSRKVSRKTTKKDSRRRTSSPRRKGGDDDNNGVTYYDNTSRPLNLTKEESDNYNKTDAVIDDIINENDTKKPDRQNEVLSNSQQPQSRSPSPSVLSRLTGWFSSSNKQVQEKN